VFLHGAFTTGSSTQNLTRNLPEHPIYRFIISYTQALEMEKKRTESTDEASGHEHERPKRKKKRTKDPDFIELSSSETDLIEPLPQPLGECPQIIIIESSHFGSYSGI
jgi:hypothetical protein